MGDPPPVQGADPAVWVQSRQFTGRIVSVSNARIFDEAVFNYTRHLPFIWEEMRLPLAYRDDRLAAERILLEGPAARGRSRATRSEGVRPMKDAMSREVLEADGLTDSGSPSRGTRLAPSPA